MKRFDRRIVLALYILFIGWMCFFSYSFYLEEEKNLYHQIDIQLSSIARGSTMLLPDDFHEKVIAGQVVTSADDEHNINRLTRLASSFHVAYIYTAIVRDGNVLITASSVVCDTNNVKKMTPRFGSKQNSMLKNITYSIKNNKVVFDEVKNQYGTFKYAMVPIRTSNGDAYVSVVGIDENALRLLLRKQGLKHLLFALGIALVSLPLFLYHYREIKQVALTDSLTKLPNRLEFQSKSTYVLSMSKRNKHPFVMMYLDLDGFKNVNDTLGHDAGDELLVQVSNRLSGAVRKSDIVSRQGGDEFVLLLPETELSGAEKAAKKILESIAKPYVIKGNDVNVTFSIGLSIFPADGTELYELSKKADAAMYVAKTNGKNCFVIYEESIKDHHD